MSFQLASDGASFKVGISQEGCRGLRIVSHCVVQDLFLFLLLLMISLIIWLWKYLPPPAQSPLHQCCLACLSPVLQPSYRGTPLHCWSPISLNSSDCSQPPKTPPLSSTWCGTVLSPKFIGFQNKLLREWERNSLAAFKGFFSLWPPNTSGEFQNLYRSYFPPSRPLCYSLLVLNDILALFSGVCFLSAMGFASQPSTVFLVFCDKFDSFKLVVFGLFVCCFALSSIICVFHVEDSLSYPLLVNSLFIAKNGPTKSQI